MRLKILVVSLVTILVGNFSFNIQFCIISYYIFCRGFGVDCRVLFGMFPFCLVELFFSPSMVVGLIAETCIFFVFTLSLSLSLIFSMTASLNVSGKCKRRTIAIGIGALSLNLFPACPLLAEGIVVGSNFSLFYGGAGNYITNTYFGAILCFSIYYTADRVIFFEIYRSEDITIFLFLSIYVLFIFNSQLNDVHGRCSWKNCWTYIPSNKKLKVSYVFVYFILLYLQTSLNGVFSFASWRDQCRWWI